MSFHFSKNRFSANYWHHEVFCAKQTRSIWTICVYFLTLFPIKQYKKNTEVSETQNPENQNKFQRFPHRKRHILFLRKTTNTYICIQHSNAMQEQTSDVTMVLVGHFTLKEKVNYYDGFQVYYYSSSNTLFLNK